MSAGDARAREKRRLVLSFVVEEEDEGRGEHDGVLSVDLDDWITID